MARRRARWKVRRWRVLVPAAVAVIGVALGAAIAGSDRLRNALFPSGSPGEPLRSPPSHAVVDDRTLDEALHRAIGRVGTVVTASARDQTRALGSRILVWRARTLEVRLRVRTVEATRVLAEATADAGGEVLSR